MHERRRSVPRRGGGAGAGFPRLFAPLPEAGVPLAPRFIGTVVA